MTYVHGLFVIAMIALWVFAGLTGLLSSVTFVSHISMLALVYAGLAAWQGARAEESSEKDDE